jgi:hypothetical protein
VERSYGKKKSSMERKNLTLWIHSTNGSTFTELEIVDCVMLLFAIQILKEISNKKKLLWK